jgi:hypothetical protein
MTATIVSPLSRTQWRLLNHLDTAWRHGPARVNAHIMLAVEDGTHSDLEEMQDAGHIEAFLADTPVVVADVVGRFGSLGMEVKLTARGRKTVTGTPWMRVLRFIRQGGEGCTVKRVRTEADVDDDLLKQMDNKQLIESRIDSLPMSNFRRLPDGLLLRLTDRGREYLPR